MTLGECAALQTFPAGYPFAGPVEDRYRQVGNAVPPMLAAAIARAIRVAEDGAATVREGLPALGAFADRVLARAVVVVRARPPRGVDPDDIDGFVERYAGRLRAHVADTLWRKVA